MPFYLPSDKAKAGPNSGYYDPIKARMGVSSYTSRMNLTCTTRLDPLLLLLRQHAVLDHSSLNGNTCKTFEAKPNIPIEVASCLRIQIEFVSSTRA